MTHEEQLDDLRDGEPERWRPTPAEQMIDYANECIDCPCGKTDWVDGDVTDGGTSSGLPDSATVHWFDGYARCACGQKTHFSDSS